MRASWRVVVVAAGALSLSVAAAGSAAASTRAGSVTPAWPGGQGMTTGVRAAGARDGSAAGAARPEGSWGRAMEVPGLGALNADGFAEVLSVSCGSAGSCAAGGYYRDRRGRSQGFEAVERGGRWGAAIEVAGLGALNAGGAAEVLSVSCGSAGNCAAGGYYTGRRGRSQGFVAVERGGRWGRAMEVPGLGALNAGGFAEVSSVSCGSAGSCAAGGHYGTASGSYVGFVAVGRGGRWGTAIEVPGLAALNKDGLGLRLVGVVRPGRRLRGRRGLHRRPPSLPGVRRERDGIMRSSGGQRPAGIAGPASPRGWSDLAHAACASAGGHAACS